MSTHFTGTSALERRDRHGFGSRSPLRLFAAALAGVFGAVAAQYRMRREVDQLRSLSDATLKDIGISRSDIVPLVRANRMHNFGARHARR